MPTRADFETEIVSRCSQLMAAVGMAVTTAGSSSPNADLTGALGWSYAILGFVPLTGIIPDDADDLANMGAATFYDLCDLGEYRTLFNCRNRWTKVNIQVGPNALYESTLRDSLDRRLAQLEAMLKSRFALGASRLSGGSIKLADARDRDRCDEFGVPTCAAGRRGWGGPW